MRFLLTLACALTLSAHSAESKKLVIIGDSLTEGYGVARAQAYPALVEKEIAKSGKAWRVINAGISGSTSASAYSQVQWHLKQKPDLLILALGANDGLRGSSVQAMEANLERAVVEAKKANVPVILAGMQMPPNYGAKYSREFAAVYPRVAKKHSIPLLPFLLSDVGGHSEMNLTDGIHPNEKGHERIAKTVYEFIKKYL